MQEVTSTQFQDQPKAAEPVKDPTNAPALNGSKLNANFYERTRTTIYMIISFLLILAAGQIYTCLLVQFLNFLVFSEINNIKRNEQKEVNIPMTKYINWYFFGIYNYYSLGKFIANKIPSLGFEYPLIGKLLVYHSFINFCLFMIGFLWFVLTLKQGYLKYQFKLFGWILISTVLVCTQAWFMCSNIYQGMIWFIIPTLLIIINDIFAYLFGYFFGKHQLIALSPKKTWEGYIGGALSTVIFSILLTQGLQSIDGITCLSSSVSFNPFNYPVCKSFVLNTIKFGPLIITELQAHVMIFSLFASIIGPFGGFFASGLKRAIKIKDFANLIPGHGGVSDRMDCQLIMGAFVYFYYHTFVKIISVDNAAYIISLLSPDEQIKLYVALQNNLDSLGLLA